MAYDDTNCPCGGRKLPETMLCDACLQHFADNPDMRVVQDESFSVNQRRSSAIAILSLSRRRKNHFRLIP